jgi:hypothetical protein
LPIKKANTGIDAEGNYRHFIKGDICSNIDVFRPQQRNLNVSISETPNNAKSTPVIGPTFIRAHSVTQASPEKSTFSMT